VNSVRDFNHGAVKERDRAHYFIRFGQRKRFFDEASVDGLLASGFETIEKKGDPASHAKEKKVWEFAAIKKD
jgi:hypothetical protein